MKRSVMTQALALLLGAVPIASQQLPIGFFADTWDQQAVAEEVFLSSPSPEKARRWLAQLTEEPHVAGTPQEKRVADYVRQRLEAFGLETEVVEYEVYLDHPKKVTLHMVQPERIELSLQEESLDMDKDSSSAGMFPAFHGYSASGTASGQIVYVNYGRPEDFERLDELGISTEGRVVLARYGQLFRGLKVWQAELHGAVGVLLFSDPADDGYMKGDVYPQGPMRPPSAIQRGSVQFLSHQPGDPSTPGYPARPGAPRLSRSEMRGMPTIPSLPISYGEAEKILRRLGGPRVPDEWQGGLPFAYHIGPGAAAVEMEVEMDGAQRPIYNVFGRIRGREEAERLVILGNHRDAWNHGAVDPNSGTAVWLEVARGLAAAVESGWRPRRTILLASWDAEEYGLVGSVEWGEDRATELTKQAVAYVNLDSAVTGTNLSLEGTPSLKALAMEVTGALQDPERGGSLLQAWKQKQHAMWAKNSPIDLDRPTAEFDLRLGSLGSGSDYTVFLDHLGVPALNFSFSGPYGVYHSVYDNFRWMEQHGDPGFIYHRAAAQLFGLLAMRLAAPEVIPMRFGTYAADLESLLEDLQRQLMRKKREASIAESTRVALEVDFGPVESALEELGNAGSAADQTADSIVAARDSEAAARLNDAFITVERQFLTQDGLPERPWFRHALFAPGLTTGYAAWPFPQLAEAVETGDRELFARGSEEIVARIGAAVERLRKAGAVDRR